MEKISSAADQLWVLATTYGMRVIGVIVVFVLAWFVAGLVRRALRRSLEKAKVDVTLSRFFANTARYIILIMAALGCLGVFGIQTTSFAAVLGASALAIGLAFQGTFANIAAGMMLLIFRPFKVGDYVILGGTAGTVEEIGLFTTDLKTVDNRLVIVPNGSIFGSTIENVTHFPIRRVDVPVGVSYSADVDQTKEVLTKAAAGVTGVIKDPPTQIFLKELGGSSVDWVIRAWCNTPDYWNVYQELIRAAKYGLDNANISIPFPQMDIHFDAPVTEAYSHRQPEARA